MKKFFENQFKWMVLMIVIAALSGCSIATMSSKPGEYGFSGMTRNPEAMAQTLSDNYVQEVNAQQYWKAVEQGRAYPYPGGGYGNDYQYYFGGVIPPAGDGPAMVPPPSGSPYATQEELRKVDEKANDSLRMHKRLRQRLQTGGSSVVDEPPPNP